MRSTTGTGRAIFADSVRRVDPDLAARIERLDLLVNNAAAYEHADFRNQLRQIVLRNRGRIIRFFKPVDTVGEFGKQCQMGWLRRDIMRHQHAIGCQLPGQCLKNSGFALEIGNP